MLLKVFYELVYALHLFGNHYSLWAVTDALAASDAVVCLSESGHRAVVTYQEGTASTPIVGILGAFIGQISFLDAFIIMREYGWNI